VTLVDHAYAALAARVDGLQDGGEPDVFEFPERLIDVCNHGELGLRYFVFLQVEAHGGFVGHAVRGFDADPGQAEPFGDRCGDRDGAIARDRDDCVDGVTPADLYDTFQVGEVRDFGDVGYVKRDGGGVSVDGNNPPPCFTGLADCSELGDACSQKEHGRHAGRS
jgi:hypothetical protein